MQTALIVTLIVVVVVSFLLREKNTAASSLSGPVPKPEKHVTRDPASNRSLIPDDELLSHYTLSVQETEFLGEWKEGLCDGVRIAFQLDECQLTVYAGDFDADQEQLSDLYMGKVSANLSLPRASEQRIDAFVAEQKKELATKYFLLATGAEAYPELKNLSVCDALLGLSEAVMEVGFFESFGGIQLELARNSLTKNSLDSDVRLAVRMFKAIKAMR